MKRLLLVLVLCGFASLAFAQEAKKRSLGYPPEFAEAKSLTYKTVGDVKLNLYVFNPPGHKPTDQRPAIVFFFGGGWSGGSPGQFHEQCKHLASLGMVAITADYRVASRHDVKAVSCVADAKSAVRFVRQQAAKLGIDPNKIAAGGGSAGGHLAACTGLIQSHDETGEDKSISSVPNLLVLFNPALVLAPVEGVDLAAARAGNLADRLGVAPRELSPYHHIRRGAPPTLVLHGKADTTVPYSTAELFAKGMTAAGNDCVLIGYEGQPHGFFNFGRGGGGEYYTKTVAAMDEFLASHGFLPKRAK
ncbi:MAG: alpha/beta hydrolase [Pirellulaceae bacterium]|nr:alpha/beta hydrolase [Pirellulaceae bacterium]